MPHHESAMKRIRQDKKRRARNRSVKSEIKVVTKKVVDAKGREEGEKLASQAASVIDRAAKKGTIHWKTAARKKSRLAKRVKSLEG